MNMRIGLQLAGLTLLTACGGGGEKQPTMTHDAPTATAMPGAPLTPREGGKVIAIEMTTDENGNNKFVPNEFEAHQGDVLRFTLGTGVHNVHFPADSNRGVTSLPPASPMLQVPGQTYDILVDFPEGRYFFQCDPHALLGMVGRLKVEDNE